MSLVQADDPKYLKAQSWAMQEFWNFQIFGELKKS